MRPPTLSSFSAGAARTARKAIALCTFTFHQTPRPWPGELTPHFQQLTFEQHVQLTNTLTAVLTAYTVVSRSKWPNHPQARWFMMGPHLQETFVGASAIYLL